MIAAVFQWTIIVFIRDLFSGIWGVNSILFALVYSSSFGINVIAPLSHVIKNVNFFDNYLAIVGPSASNPFTDPPVQLTAIIPHQLRAVQPDINRRYEKEGWKKRDKKADSVNVTPYDAD